MQLLIVHHDLEVGEGLHAMLRAYSPDEVDYVGSDAAAHVQAARHPDCDGRPGPVAGAGGEGGGAAGQSGGRGRQLLSWGEAGGGVFGLPSS